MSETSEHVIPLSELGRTDGDRVGGKNPSLGEMIRHLRDEGIRVPGGFATTAAAYWSFVEAVTGTIADLLAAARRTGGHTGICGRAPSDQPELARFLVEHGIDSISVGPDSFLRVKQQIAAAEAAA